MYAILKCFFILLLFIIIQRLYHPVLLRCFGVVCTTWVNFGFFWNPEWIPQFKLTWDYIYTRVSVFVTNQERFDTGFVLVFRHKTWIAYRKIPILSRIQDVMNRESKVETLYPNTLNPQRFVCVNRLSTNPDIVCLPTILLACAYWRWQLS